MIASMIEKTLSSLVTSILPSSLSFFFLQYIVTKSFKSNKMISNEEDTLKMTKSRCNSVSSEYESEYRCFFCSHLSNKAYDEDAHYDFCPKFIYMDDSENNPYHNYLI